MEKLGRIPDGGGHKMHGREAGRPIRGMGFDYVHSAVDDHSRLAHRKIHPDEKAATCAAFLTRAAGFFHRQGITRTERVPTDNAWAYRKDLARKNVLAGLGATGKLTHAYRPQTNGKVERLNRILLDGHPSVTRVNDPPVQYTQGPSRDARSVRPGRLHRGRRLRRGGSPFTGGAGPPG